MNWKLMFLLMIIIYLIQLLVIKEEDPIEVCKTWIKAPKLFWPKINNDKNISKDDLSGKFSNDFDDVIGTIKGPPVSIKLRNDIKPVFKVCNNLFSFEKVWPLLHLLIVF